MAKQKPKIDERLQTFEKELDERLAACATYRMDAGIALRVLVDMSDLVAHEQPLANALDRAIDVLAPFLVSGRAGTDDVDPEHILADVTFAASYFLLREYLYYSYNSPGAFEWIVGDKQIEIRFLDKSIPRQFYTSQNESILGSRQHFLDKEKRSDLMERLREVGEWDKTQDDALIALLEAEADHKLSAYFSIIPRDSQIDLGGYTYAQFFALYRMLLAKALWHRYHAALSGERGAVYIAEEDLVGAAHQALGIDEAIIRLILRDMVFDVAADADRLSPSYFSLLRDGAEGGIWMRPIHFCLHEGVVGFLRVVGQRRNQVFLDQVSNALGAGLAERVATAFEAQGFQCKTEVDLTDFDPALPDIDLLVISEEPTLGYVILVCELKSPVPAMWAKDHLRALNKDGVSKAFHQCQKIGEFLRTAEGLALVRQWLPVEGLPHFDHFVAVLEPLVITSHNSGMFFDAMRTPVFGYQTIERMLRASDGDMAYIQRMLRTYCGFVDANLVVQGRSAQLQDTYVQFDVVGSGGVINFPPNQWRSDGSRERHASAFIASGENPGRSIPHAMASAGGSGREAALAATKGDSDGQRTVVLFDGNLGRIEHLMGIEAAPEE
jgi:hypothetical protein